MVEASLPKSYYNGKKILIRHDRYKDSVQKFRISHDHELRFGVQRGHERNTQLGGKNFGESAKLIAK